MTTFAQRMVALLVLLAAYASPLSAQRSEKKCRDTPIDSTTPSSPVYHDCHPDHSAKLRGTPPRLDWQPGSGETRNGACFSADFEFVVDTLGVPELSTVRAGRSTNAAYADAVQRRIASLRFTPAERDGQLVRQIVAWREKMGMRVVASSSPSAGPPRTRPPNC